MNAQHFFNLGHACFMRSDYRSAIIYYSLALSLCGDKAFQAIIHEHWGEACRAFGRVDEAIVHYGEALALYSEKDSRVCMHHTLGLLYATIDEFDDAIHHYAEALDLISDDDNVLKADIHYRYGLVCSKLAKCDESIANYADSHYKQALKLNPNLMISKYFFNNLREQKEDCTHSASSSSVSGSFSGSRQALFSVANVSVQQAQNNNLQPIVQPSRLIKKQ